MSFVDAVREVKRLAAENERLRPVVAAARRLVENQTKDEGEWDEDFSDLCAAVEEAG